jgi:hypothetical protein
VLIDLQVNESDADAADPQHKKCDDEHKARKRGLHRIFLF